MSSVKLRKEKDCLNCGHVVEENFCPQCGQENIVVKEDALHMVTHAIADYFHFEHKFFGTLKPLLLKPGKLTQQYVDGKRVAFIHPIRLYIFVSIVFFIVILNRTASDIKLDNETEIENSNHKTQNNKTNNSKKINFSSNWNVKQNTVKEYEKSQDSLPKTLKDGFFKHLIIKKNLELNAYPNPTEKFIEAILHNIPKMMFLLLPLFALILKLTYYKRNKYYYEHLIYSFHTQSAIFISVLFVMLLSWICSSAINIQGVLTVICLGYIMWYIYRSLKTF